MKQLTIEQIIRILSDNKIIFKTEIPYVGQDTNYDEIEFTFDEEDKYTSFTYNLNLDIHGANIESHLEGWYFKVYTEDEFFKVIDINREPYTDFAEKKK